MSLEQAPARQRQRTNMRPRFGKIPDALDYGAISRSKLYLWSRERPELFRKLGRGTLVDFEILDQMLDALPVAGIKNAK